MIQKLWVQCVAYNSRVKNTLDDLATKPIFVEDLNNMCQEGESMQVFLPLTDTIKKKITQTLELHVMCEHTSVEKDPETVQKCLQMLKKI